jgi:hypothetical protein
VLPEDRGRRLSWPDASAVTGLAIVAAGVYLPRLLPSSGYSPDTMKYHYIGAVLGISHAPGSPLYILINWVVAQIPFGELAWRLNLLSAVAAASAAAALYLVCRELEGGRLPALVASLTLLTTAIFWEQSIVAEVYTPHATFLLASTWFLLRWHRTGATRDLGAAAMLYGLSFGIHLMSWYFLPGWIALLLAGPRSIVGRRHESMLVTVGAVAGMSTYVYYAIRPAMQPLYVEVEIDSVRAFFDYITGGDFKRRMFAYDMQTMAGERMMWLFGLLRANLGLPILFASVGGLVVLFVRSVHLGVVVAAPVLLGSAYAMGYAVGDARIFALPAVYMLLVAAAVGLGWISARAASLGKLPWVGRVTTAALLGLIALERSPDVARNSVVLNRSDDRRFADYAVRILTDVERGSTIVAGSDWIFHALAYQHWGRGLRSNGRLFLQTAEPEGCDATRQSVDLYLARGPVYGTTGVTACLEAHYTLGARDLSRTLPDYLSAVPPGRLLVLAIQEEGVAGIDRDTWGSLQRLGILAGMRDRVGWSYAAALMRTADGFAGVQRASDTGAAIRFERRSSITDGTELPFDLTVRSGGASSGHAASIVADGVEYAQSRRGLQIVIFDGRLGVPLDRQVFDTNRTISLREFGFFRVIGRKGPSGTS